MQAGLEARAKVILAGLKGRWAVLGLMAVLVLSGGAEALQINPIFVSGGGESWDSTRIGVINQAIADWELSVLDEQIVDVSFTFSEVGTSGYLGTWNGSGSFAFGTIPATLLLGRRADADAVRRSTASYRGSE